MVDETRRTFVKRIGAASALAAGSFLNWNPRALGANDKIVMALIGGRNQGRNDALGAISHGAEFKTFCDIDQAILDKINPELRKSPRQGAWDDQRLRAGARRQRHRRRPDCHARPLARADRHFGVPGGKGHLHRKAADANHPRWTNGSRCGAQIQADWPGGHTESERAEFPKRHRIPENRKAW